jgi:hypothetical protein
MSVQVYLKHLSVGTEPSSELLDLIESMTHSERVELRNELTKIGENRQLRSLYYDYAKQVWID